MVVAPSRRATTTDEPKPRNIAASVAGATRAKARPSPPRACLEQPGSAHVARARWTVEPDLWAGAWSSRRAAFAAKPGCNQEHDQARRVRSSVSIAITMAIPMTVAATAA